MESSLKFNSAVYFVCTNLTMITYITKIQTSKLIIFDSVHGQAATLNSVCIFSSFRVVFLHLHSYYCYYSSSSTFIYPVFSCLFFKIPCMLSVVVTPNIAMVTLAIYSTAVNYDYHL